MQNVKINGVPYNFPTDVRDLTLKQFFALRNAKDILDEIAALTGIARNTIENFKDVKTIQIAVGLCNTLAKSIKKGFDGKTMPNELTIEGVTVPIPRDLHIAPIGAFMSVTNLLAEANKKMFENNPALKASDIDYTDCIPQTLAYYLYLPYFTDQIYFTDEAAEAPEWLDKIMSLRFVDAVPVANHFFLKFPHLT